MGSFNNIYLRVKSYLDTRKRIKGLQKTVNELTAIDKNSPQEQQFNMGVEHSEALIQIWLKTGVLDELRLEVLHEILPDALASQKSELALIARTLETINKITQDNFATPYRDKWLDKAFKKRDHIINRILKIEEYMRELSGVMRSESKLKEIRSKTQYV
jgi:hypothetical protein